MDGDCADTPPSRRRQDGPTQVGSNQEMKRSMDFSKVLCVCREPYRMPIYIYRNAALRAAAAVLRLCYVYEPVEPSYARTRGPVIIR